MPRSFAGICAYALTFPPIDPGDKGATLTPQAALLKNLGIKVMGEHEGTQRIEVYSEFCRKTTTIYDIDKITIHKLVQIVGDDKVEEFVHDGKEPPAGKVQVKDVRRAICSEASRRAYVQEEKHGAGVWDVDGYLAIVQAGSWGLLNGTGKIEYSQIPFHRSKMLDLSGASGNWYEPGQLDRAMVEAKRVEWRAEAFKEAEALFRKWYWRYDPSPEVLASLVICSWVQTVWEWRPQVAISGGSDTGKSLLMEEVLRGIFGPLCLYIQKPTEAAIRQAMRHHARVILVDEFEQDAHRQKVLDLFRTSSRGGEVYRGTADQKGTKFGLKHIPWVGSIETGLKQQADRNRFIMLELSEIPQSMRGKVMIPGPAGLRDLGVKLLACALTCQHEARRLSTTLRGGQYRDVPGRVVEGFSVPAAMYGAVHGLNAEKAADWMAGWLGGWDFGAQQGQDQVALLQEIFMSEVSTERGGRATVSQLIRQFDDPGVRANLNRVGIDRFKRKPQPNGLLGQECIFFAPASIGKNLLRPSSDFYGHALDQYLTRIKGAKRDRQRLGGHDRFSGVSIPVDVISEMFEWNHSEHAATPQTIEFE